MRPPMVKGAFDHFDIGKALAGVQVEEKPAREKEGLDHADIGKGLAGSRMEDREE